MKTDFYCHELKLVIEVDGEVHSDTEPAEYDKNRTAELNKYGIKVVRFSNDHVIHNTDMVIDKIKHILTELTPL
jgi:very-short-patch-repair endonuclease